MLLPARSPRRKGGNHLVSDPDNTDSVALRQLRPSISGVPHTILNHVQGDMTQLTVTSHGESGLDVLSRHVAVDALHSSGEQFPQPACHAGTRTRVLEELQEWSMEEHPASRLLWLYGAAGAGKSAIAQTFASTCDAGGCLGGSFFFKRNHPTRGNWKGFILTLAYQLAMSSADLRLHIQNAMESDKLITGQAMETQFERLIVRPIEEMQPVQLQCTIVLDGLDECDGHNIQVRILRLIVAALQSNRISLRVLIASRPEPHLQEVLENVDALMISRHIQLHADESAYSDIRTYLRAEFARINQEHNRRGTVLDRNWPGEKALRNLVSKSSGMFIYAATVVRFVDDEYSDPRERLTVVLQLGIESIAPLDELYTEILSFALPTPSFIKMLFCAIRGMHQADIDDLLALPDGSARRALRGLHSVLEIPPERPFGYRTPTKVLHTSFRDFLADPARSQDYHTSNSTMDALLIRTVLKELYADGNLRPSFLPYPAVRNPWLTGILKYCKVHGGIYIQPVCKCQTDLPSM
ncbi:hypothetical protein DFH09DRAFT_1163934 [Mycena vulgaris]|nr:hypothetical protein DFH09DRAFT_1163934 [Mycena vulgaris]